MKLLAVDDEELALKNLELELLDCTPVKSVTTFTSPEKALTWLEKNYVDAAFLDIDMRQMDGLTLAKKIKDLHSNCAIVFVTGYSEYAVKAFSLKVCGYLVKPIVTEDVQRELDYICAGLHLATSQSGRLRVQCFGTFEVFWDGNPVSFPRQKSKELFAYLIDRRGAQVSMAEIASILWEDGRYDISRNRQIHSFLHDLVKTMDVLGVKDIIIRRRNAIAVDISKMNCDAYACFDGDLAAINAYHGEYMSQYPWSEFTTGTLTNLFT